MFSYSTMDRDGISWIAADALTRGDIQMHMRGQTCYFERLLSGGTASLQQPGFCEMWKERFRCITSLVDKNQM